MQYKIKTVNQIDINLDLVLSINEHLEGRLDEKTFGQHGSSIVVSGSYFYIDGNGDEIGIMRFTNPPIDEATMNYLQSLITVDGTNTWVEQLEELFYRGFIIEAANRYSLDVADFQLYKRDSDDDDWVLA